MSLPWASLSNALFGIQGQSSSSRSRRGTPASRDFIDGRAHADIDAILRHSIKRANLRASGWHTLRRTFCSHLAMRGVPVRTIQELAGHASITTMMRYMQADAVGVDDLDPVRDVTRAVKSWRDLRRRFGGRCARRFRTATSDDA